jgi:hypothetical protein
MPFFKIFRNPVEMIKVMSKIQVAGKMYKKNESDGLIREIGRQIEVLEGYFEASGIPDEVTRAHSGILFEMAVKGDNIPPLVALEHALMETLDEDDLEFGFVDDQEASSGLTPEQDKQVSKMIRGLKKEEGDE